MDQVFPPLVEKNCLSSLEVGEYRSFSMSLVTTLLLIASCVNGVLGHQKQKAGRNRRNKAFCEVVNTLSAHCQLKKLSITSSLFVRVKSGEKCNRQEK